MHSIARQKPSERTSDFWMVQFLKTESELNFGFPHISTNQLMSPHISTNQLMSPHISTNQLMSPHYHYCVQITVYYKLLQIV